MKKSVLILAMIAFGLQSYAQVYAQGKVIYSATIEKEQVPEVILEAVETDFPDYIVEEYDAVPIDYVEDDVYVNKNVDLDDMNSYQMEISSKGRRLVANYDADGNLMSTIENLKDVAPSFAMRESIESEYPGWTISKDSYHMSKYGKGKTKERYKFVLTKDGKKKRIYTDSDGEILD
ncbi:MAG: hypothetical protein ACTIJ9_16200 [Aequorivita sp.]